MESPDQRFEQPGFHRDPATGTVTGPAGARVVYASHNFMRSLHHAMRSEKPGAWQDTFKKCGVATGKTAAARLDAEFIRLGQPVLAAMPLESCVVLLERHLASHGWGLLKLDLADAAAHGVVTARLPHSYFVEVLGDVDDLVDPVLAGILQGFFEHVSGQELGCLELACARRGAAHCTFAITAPDRLAAIVPLVGSATAESIIARLKA